MNEVKEFLQKTGHSLESEPLDPQVAEAGVVDVEQAQQDQLNKIQDHMSEVYALGENTQISDPHPDSENQVNEGPSAAVILPPQGGYTIDTFVGAVGETISNFVRGLLHPEESFQSANSIHRRTTVKEMMEVAGIPSNITHLPPPEEPDIIPQREEEKHAA